MKRRRSRTKLTRYFLCIIATIATVMVTKTPVQAQISYGGEPYSFRNPIQSQLQPTVIPSVDIRALLAQDEARRARGEELPFRYGAPIDVDLGLSNAGTWEELPNGARLWRLKIVSPKANAVSLIYNKFFMPAGATFFVYNKDGSMVIGAFTEENNREHGKFSTAPVKGSVITLEYYEPVFARGQGGVHVSRVIHGFRGVPVVIPTGQSGAYKVTDFGDSDQACQVNINCSQGASWQDEKRSVALILTPTGRQCTGALVNNKRGDLTPYFLTAQHCLDGQEYGWIFRFNYESPNCSNIDGPYNQTVSGAFLEASNGASDFALLKLYKNPPRAYNAYYAGWSRSATAPSQTVMIHHPRGDIKKIAIDDDQAVSSTWTGTPSGSHWELYFDQGANEPGSSGAPYFNENGLVVGQHHGNLDPLYNGNNDCEVPHAWGGKFSISWGGGGSSSTRLKDWLDPDNNGGTTLDGMNDPRPYPPTNVYITGSVGTMPRVNWTASSSPVSYYKVYRRRTANFPGPWSVIGTTSATSWVDSQITIENPNNADDYYAYKVTAMGTNGWESESSNQVGTYGKSFCPSCKAGDQDNTEAVLPETYALYQNYPNPFNPQTVIHFDLPEAGHVSLVVYDISGREIVRLVDGNKEAGNHHITWDARDLPSGVYIYSLTAKEFTQTRRMTLVK